MNRPIFHLNMMNRTTIRHSSKLVYSMVKEQIWIELLNFIGSCCGLNTHSQANVKWWVSLLKQSPPFVQMCSDIKSNLFIFISIAQIDGNESFYSLDYDESFKNTQQFDVTLYLSPSFPLCTFCPLTLLIKP